MKTSKQRYITLASLILFSQVAYGQSGGNGSNLLVWSLIALALVLIVLAVLSLADNLIQIEADNQGVDTKKNNLGIFPSFSSLFGKKAPTYVKDAGFHSFSKGYDLKLTGQPSNSIHDVAVSHYAVKPTDFNGISPIPKMMVAVGDEVKAGDPLFFDKKRPEIMYASPVSGEVVEIKRGDKRAIVEVIVLADKETQYATHETPSQDAPREELVDFLSKSGVWALFNQRPYDIVAERNVVPANIFVSTFDTAPLAVDNNLVVAGKEGAFQKGLDVLTKLTSGKVYLGVDGRGEKPSAAFTDAQGVEINYFAGQHPAGNVGVQIHHTAPITGGEKVWTLGVQDVITLGTLFLDGKYDMQRVVSVGGGQFAEPKLVRTAAGASIADLVKAVGLKEGKSRIIDGDVLSGKQTTTEGYTGIKTDQLTAIKEGDYHEMFGWLLPITPRPSISGTFPNALFKEHKFDGDTNTHGEKRAFVVSGQYESVLPMDIYPQHLMKAIMAGDIEKMEGLGINELSEEDLALCEFVCTSKMPLQSILRGGLEMMREQS